MKNITCPNTNFAKHTTGICHTSDLLRSHKMVVEQLDSGKYRLLDFISAKPVSKKRAQAFLDDCVKTLYFI